jgi:hypothetical protein
MPKKSRSTAPVVKNSNRHVLRYAHPFFTPTPVNIRAVQPKVGQRMLDYIQGSLHQIPPLKRNNGQWSLEEIIGKDGASAIEDAGQITIHIAGDTGVPEIDRETRQVMVAEAMARDYDVNKPDTNPAFFLHVGDVIYGQSPTAYLDQFYRPYMHYPGKIIAIPGNHDGDTDTKIADFQKYFCASSQAVPPTANSIFRQTMTQPGVYWCLDTPFVQIIGLYSNSAENPGFISGPQIGDKQKQWLLSTLKSLKAERSNGTRKALLFATHHPPYSSGGHTGSSEMLKDIDDACDQAGIMPDAFFSGHAHSIQHYTRTTKLDGQLLKIPFIISGCGGHGDQKVAPVNGQGNVVPNGDHTYDFGYQGWGYTTVVITNKSLTITSYGVDWNSTKELRSISVDLAAGQPQAGPSRFRGPGVSRSTKLVVRSPR